MADALQSMTGYARATGAVPGVSFVRANVPSVAVSTGRSSHAHRVCWTLVLPAPADATTAPMVAFTGYAGS